MLGDLHADRLGWLRDRETIFAHALEVELNGFTDVGFGLFWRCASGYAAVQIWDPSAEIILAFFDDYGVLDHTTSSRSVLASRYSFLATGSLRLHMLRLMLA